MWKLLLRHILFDMSDPNTCWLNYTNLALGLLALVCLLVVGRTLILEISTRMEARRLGTLDAEDLAFLHAQVGTTLVDGGERQEPEEEK